MIALGSDHAGYELKQEIIAYLKEKNLEYEDFGCFDTRSVDYADYAHAAAHAVADGRCDKGILVCGTGIGIGIAANKVPGIRCATLSDCFSAEATRLHNDANMMALGSRVIGPSLAIKIVETFLTTPFSGEERHQRRINKIEQI